MVRDIDGLLLVQDRISQYFLRWPISAKHNTHASKTQHTKYTENSMPVCREMWGGGGCARTPHSPSLRSQKGPPDGIVKEF